MADATNIQMHAYAASLSGAAPGGDGGNGE